MKEKVLWLWDWTMVWFAYIILRSRWVYFHIHPNYIKFKMDEEESHFQHKITGELHSDIRIELRNGWRV